MEKLTKRDLMTESYGDYSFQVVALFDKNITFN